MVSIGSLEIWLEKNEIYYTVSEQLYLFLFGVNTQDNVKPLIPLPVGTAGKSNKTLLALPDVLLLNSKLPKRASRWTLAHMLDNRSQNWETLKDAIYGKGQTIIVIQDANGDIFGMYGSHKWVPSDGFFGNNECFLFTLKPDVNIYEGSGRDDNFQLFNESGIGMGGTGDRLGLFIQSKPVKGSTSLSCSTFRGFWPLARELEFKITCIEVWEIEYAQANTAVEQDIENIIDEKAPEVPAKSMQLKCSGECAMQAQRKNDNNYRGCCLKRCSKKTAASRSINPCGEAYRNTQKKLSLYPKQEQEMKQRSPNELDKKIKSEKNELRSSRISFESRQKHGAAPGFIHPSLAAEENERNKMEAAVNSSRQTPPSSSNFTRDALSVAGKSNRTIVSKREIFAPERSPTFSHQITQVGESKLIKTATKNKNSKCACVVKKTCACPPKNPTSGKTFNSNEMNKNTNTAQITSNESKATKTTIYSDSNPIINPPKGTTNESKLTKMAVVISDDPDEIMNSSQVSQMKCDESKATKTAVTDSHGITTSSSSLAVILDTMSPQSIEMEKPGIRVEQPTEANRKPQAVPDVKPALKTAENKGNTEDKIFKKQITLTSTSRENKEENVLSMQAEIDCHCSSSMDFDDVEAEIIKMAKTACSTCCCETKVSSYMKRTDRPDITGVPLSEISSSVCSCILDNKPKITTTSKTQSENSCKKDEDCLTRSRKKSERNTDSPSYPIMPTKHPALNQIRKSSPSHSVGCKKETQYHTKSRRTSKTSSRKVSSDAYKPPQPVPPTCLRCKTLVSKYGCQCKVMLVSNDNKNLSPLQTTHLLHKEPEKNQAELESEESRQIIATDMMAQKPQDSEEPSTNKVNGGISQVQIAEKKSCKTSCRCSLSRTYFPAFPEDFIEEEENNVDDCDCVSYDNLPFPVIIETPQNISSEPSNKSRLTVTTTDIENEREEGEKSDQVAKKCECDNNDNTIIILNMPKCNTTETVEKILHELEEKTGENSNVKSLVLKCKDFAECRSGAMASPYSRKNELEREVLRQRIDRILNRNQEEAKSKYPDQT